MPRTVILDLDEVVSPEDLRRVYGGSASRPEGLSPFPGASSVRSSGSPRTHAVTYPDPRGRPSAGHD